MSSFVYVTYIRTTPEKLWQALTSAEFSRQYFFGNSVEVEPRVGGAFIVRQADGGLHISGEVIEYDEKAHRHLQRQLAGIDREARTDAGHLGDGARGRCGAFDADRGA